jgi:hypothetical protein
MYTKNDVIQGAGKLSKNDITRGQPNSTFVPSNQKSKQSRVTTLSHYKHWYCPMSQRKQHCFQHFLALFGTFWHFLALFGTFGTCWVLFGTFGHFLALLGTFGHFWAHFGTFWHFLALFGTFWHFLAFFGTFWHFLATFMVTFCRPKYH